jgi:hypothetical protein
MCLLCYNFLPLFLTKRASWINKLRSWEASFPYTLPYLKIGLSSLFVSKIDYMTRKSKKYTILGGVKVSSRQLSEWGSSGGRPKKYPSNAEKQRAYKLRKKQARLGPEAQLEPRKSYHDTEKITRYGRCHNCGLIDDMGGAYTRSG